MDKNTVTGLVVIAAILIGFSIFNAPSAEHVAEVRMQDSLDKVAQTQLAEQLQLEQQLADSLQKIEVARQDSLNIADSIATEMLIATNPELADSLQRDKELKAQVRAEMKQQALFGQYGSFSKAGEGTDKDYVIENDKMVVTISAKGGRIASVKLKEYTTYSDSDLYVLRKATSGFGMTFKEGNTTYNTNDLFFSTKGRGFSVTNKDSSSITFRLTSDDPTKYLEYTYGLSGESYHVFFNVEAKGLDQLFDINDPKFKVHWNIRSEDKEKNLMVQKRASTVMFKPFEEKRDYIWENSSDSVVMEQDIMWVDFKQHFFSAFIVNKDGFLANESSVATNNTADETFVMDYSADLTFKAINNGKTKNGQLEFFFGPNQYHVLSQYGRDYDEVIDYGWAIFGTVNRWITIPLFNAMEGWGLSYGLIILLITLVIKMLLLPITYKNYLSSAKMKVLKPEIEAISKKYPDKKDSAKKQQATMALYSQTGVSPLAGCIPMLIQMPILYAMFRFFPSSIELRQESFLWADDLSAYDSIFDLGFDIPIYGDHISLFTLLMAASTILYTRMNSGQMSMGGGAPGMPNMKVMMYLFPVMMLFFFNNYSSALSYYYFLANMISMGQMWMVKKYFINEDKIREKIESNKKKKKKKSKFATRLEEIQKQQKTAKGGKGAK